MVCGAFCTNSGFDVASASIARKAPMNASSVSLVSDSVGSIINAS